MKVYWTVRFGQFRKSEYTFQNQNAKRDPNLTESALEFVRLLMEAPK